MPLKYAYTYIISIIKLTRVLPHNLEHIPSSMCLMEFLVTFSASGPSSCARLANCLLCKPDIRVVRWGGSDLWSLGFSGLGFRVSGFRVLHGFGS